MRKLFLPSAALLLLLTGCSDTSTPAAKKEPEKQLEPATGQSALFKMYQVARSMGTDVMVLKMNSITMNEVPNVPRGKAAVWEATFVSASNSQSRRYTYSIIEQLPTFHKGVFPSV